MFLSSGQSVSGPKKAVQHSHGHGHRQLSIGIMILSAQPSRKKKDRGMQLWSQTTHSAYEAPFYVNLEDLLVRLAPWTNHLLALKVQYIQ
jgi:hypothetical protein